MKHETTHNKQRRIHWTLALNLTMFIKFKIKIFFTCWTVEIFFELSPASFSCWQSRIDTKVILYIFTRSLKYTECSFAIFHHRHPTLLLAMNFARSLVERWEAFARRFEALMNFSCFFNSTSRHCSPLSTVCSCTKLEYWTRERKKIEWRTAEKKAKSSLLWCNLIKRPFLLVFQSFVSPFHRSRSAACCCWTLKYLKIVRVERVKHLTSGKKNEKSWNKIFFRKKKKISENLFFS